MSNKMEIDGELYDSETGELLNEVEQVEAEVVENNLPEIVCNGGTHIKTNSEQLKKELVEYLKKYDIEVTEDTEKQASKTATELNKLAKDLNSKRLAVSKEIKKPADALKSSIDELIELVQEKRTNILDKVEVFKQNRFNTIRELLEYEKDKLFSELQVSEEYQFLDIEPLVKETSLGKTNLTKGAKETLLSMVRSIKSLEDAVKTRKLELREKCVSAGLEIAIELSEVEGFIKEDDYDSRLTEIIESRLSVEKQLKEKAEREKEEQKLREEQIRKNEAERFEREKQEAIKKIEREAKAKEQARLDEIKRKEEEELRNKILEEERIKAEENAKQELEKETGKKTVRIVATFEVEVNADVANEKVINKYRTKLQDEFSTLVRVD